MIFKNKEIATLRLKWELLDRYIQLTKAISKFQFPNDDGIQLNVIQSVFQNIVANYEYDLASSSIFQLKVIYKIDENLLTESYQLLLSIELDNLNIVNYSIYKANNIDQFINYFSNFNHQKCKEFIINCFNKSK